MTAFADRWGIGRDRFWVHGERAREPVEFDAELGRWNVYGYPEIMQMFSDSTAYTPDATRLFDLDEEAAKYVEGDLAQMTGPEHAHMRKYIGRAFTVKALDDLEGRIHKTASRLLDDLAGRARFDLLVDFVEELSAIVFSELLGTPVEQREMLRLKDETMDFEGQMATVDQGEEGYFEGLVAPLKPLRGFVGEAIDRRFEQPVNDLLSLLVQFRKLDGSAMSRDEIINFAINVLGAGRLATPMLIGNTMLCLESFPDQARQVYADPSLVPGMLEETMRFLSPGNISSRVTNTDVELGGKAIPKDQLIMLWLGPANRDPRQFSDPDSYDVRRSPNAHVGFGQGTYYCIGAQLVRVETRIMFNLLREHFPRLRVDPDVPPVFFGSPEFTGVRALSVISD